MSSPRQPACACQNRDPVSTVKTLPQEQVGRAKRGRGADSQVVHPHATQNVWNDKIRPVLVVCAYQIIGNLLRSNLGNTLHRTKRLKRQGQSEKIFRIFHAKHLRAGMSAAGQPLVEPRRAAAHTKKCSQKGFTAGKHTAAPAISDRP